MADVQEVMKIDFMILVALVLHHDAHSRSSRSLWVVGFASAFYGVKGGIFTIMHGGDYRVWGPEDSFIEGNNELALR